MTMLSWEEVYSLVFEVSFSSCCCHVLLHSSRGPKARLSTQSHRFDVQYFQ